MPLLPLVLQGTEDRDQAIIDEVARQAWPTLTSGAWGMFLSVECADRSQSLGGADRATWFAERAPHRALLLIFAGPWCDLWPHGARTLVDPATIDAPALVLAGGLDPISPVEQSRELTDALGCATVVVVDDGAHGIAGETDAVSAALAGHLADPGSACRAAPTTTTAPSTTSPPGQAAAPVPATPSFTG